MTSMNLSTISRLHFKRGDNMETRERENQTACISFQDTLPLSFQKKHFLWRRGKTNMHSDMGEGYVLISVLIQ